MRFDDYDTYLMKHPYISVFTVNLAPIFSDLLGRFVYLIEKLFGTTEKTDSAAQPILKDNSSPSPSVTLDQNRVQSPPTSDFKTVPALTANSSPTTTTNARKRPSDDDDNDDVATTSTPKSIQSRATNSNRVPVDNDNLTINQLEPKLLEVFEDKNNLFQSFATALGISDIKEIKKTLIKEVEKALESVREDFEQYYQTNQRAFQFNSNEPIPGKKRLWNELADNGTLYAELTNLNNQPQAPENDEKARVILETIEANRKVNAKISAKLSDIDLLMKISDWYSGFSENEIKTLEHKRKAERNHLQSFTPRFDTKIYDPVLLMFSEGLFPTFYNYKTIKILAAIYNVKIIVHEKPLINNWDNLQVYGDGDKIIDMYLIGDQYTLSPPDWESV